MPAYLAKHGNNDINSVTHNPFSVYNNQPGKTLFQIIESSGPDGVQNFHRGIAEMDHLYPLSGIFPFDKLLGTGESVNGVNGSAAAAEKEESRTQRVALVDIGGGLGKDLIKILKHYPTLKNHLILQDLPATIDSISDEYSSKLEGIEVMAHNFFEKQKVIGMLSCKFRNLLYVLPTKLP